MKPKLLHFISFIFICAISLCAAGQASACLCPNFSKAVPLKEHVKNARSKAAAVFIGEVISESRNDTGKRLVIFKVTKMWKGVTASEITVMTGAGGADCSYFFETGKTYLVYAYDENNIYAPNEKNGEKSLYTHNCSRTTEATKAARKEIKALDKIKG